MAGPGLARAASTPDLERITEAYHRHYQSLRSLRVEYDEVSTPLVDMEVLWTQANVTGPFSRKVTVVTEGGKYYSEIETESQDIEAATALVMKDSPKRFEGKVEITGMISYAELAKKLPLVGKRKGQRILTYDGSAVREKSERPAKIKGTDEPVYFVHEFAGKDVMYLPLSYVEFTLYGPLLPGTVGDDNARKKNRIPEMFAEPKGPVSAGREKVGQTECVAVEMAGQGKVWLDPQRGFAMLRREYYTEGITEMRLEAEGFAEVLPDVWMPRTLTRTDFGGPQVGKELRGKPLTRAVMRVTKFEANKPEHATVYVLKPPAGAVVFDMTRRPVDSQGKSIEAPLPKGNIPSVSYVQPANEADLEAVIKRAEEDQGIMIQGSTPPPAWSRTRKTVVAAGLGLAAAIVAFLVWDRRRKGPAPTAGT